jgi:hypothetical protein
VPTRFHVAVRRPGDGAVLVLRDGTLPAFDLDRPPPWQVVSPAVDALRDRYDLDVVVLRACWVSEPSRDDGPAARLYEAEWVGRGSPPRGAAWTDPGSIAAVEPTLAAALAGGALVPATGDRQPWYRPGWLTSMAAWIDGRLRAAGLHRRGPLRQARSWGRSALLTLETDRGRLWAKQVPEIFAHEVAVTGLLEDCDPGLVPRLVAADAASGRMLLEHVPGDHLSADGVDPAAWTATMARLAEIQAVLAADLATLRVAGVPAAPVDRLIERVPALLADEELLLVDRPGGLSRREHRDLVARTDDVVDACRGLARSPLGPSVDHGDLTAAQVIVSEMGPVIIDWSDATITHPFIAAASFLLDPGVVPGASGGLARRSLEAAYVDRWVARDASLRAHDLHRELEHARAVHPVHMAWLYATRVLPGLEQPWEAAWLVPSLMRAGILLR